MKYLLLVMAILAGCTTTTVSTPDGCAQARVSTWTLLGQEQTTCVEGTDGTLGCTVGGQSAQQLVTTITSGVLGALAQAGVLATKAPQLRAPMAGPTNPTPSGCWALKGANNGG